MTKGTNAFLVLALVALLLPGCGTRVVCDPPPENPLDKAPVPSEQLRVSVYLDATLSMKGFIVPGLSSYYQQTLPLLESAVGRAWPTGGVRFYKFGTKVEELTGRRHLDAARQDFYGDASLNTKTYIENVIDGADPEELTVIVTDLFQDKSDVNLLIAKLKDKYINSGHAIGILAVRSQFSGTVYDVGVNNYSFQYQTNQTDPNTFRPFYSLMLGRHADVQRYSETLRAGGVGSFPQSNFVIFSRHITSPLTSFEGGKITSTDNIVEVVGLLPTGTKNGNAKQFRIRRSTEPASFSAVLSHAPAPSVVEPEPSPLAAEVTAWRCTGNRGSAAAGSGQNAAEAEKPTSLVDTPAAQGALSVKNAEISGSELRLRAEVSPSSLPGDGVYCFRIQLRPKGYRSPLWFSEWNMTQDDAERWRQSPKDFNGAMTLNIKDFLESLFVTVLQSQRPKVAELYCYVQKG